MSDTLMIKEEARGMVADFKYDSIHNIDDVILQLLNDAKEEGFIESALLKKESVVRYQIGEKTALSEIEVPGKSKEKVIIMLNDLYKKLSYLEDSFIDTEYAVFEPEHIYVEGDKLYMIVLPCPYLESASSLRNCAYELIKKYLIDDTSKDFEKLESALSSIESTIDLEALIRTIEENEFEVSEEVVVESESSQVTDLAEDDLVIAVDDALVSDDISADTIEGDDIVADDIDIVMMDDIESPEVSADTDDIKVLDLDLLLDDPVVVEDTPIVVQDEEPIIVDTESQDAVSDFDVEAYKESIKEELIAQLTDEIKAELISNLTPQIEARVREEIAMEAVSKIPEAMNGYLLRKSTGEVIPIGEGAFVIGKMNRGCDYVITNNHHISNIHAIIKFHEADKNYYITDCGSTNGVHVGVKKAQAQQPVMIEDGAIIFIADELFIFHA